jgi:c-di-GMP-binding flagellar brake protein YcgR
LTEIESYNPRKYDRDELRFNVQVYGMPESRIADTFFGTPEGHPEMSDVTFDLSVGGVCIISNTLLNSKFDPYYLLTFALSDRDRFVLPAKMVRRSNYQRTKIGRYDYGFQFLFDNIPDEKGRLSRAILTRKLSGK